MLPVSCSTDLMEENTCVVSTDEMTGVQALEHKYPHKLPLPGQEAKWNSNISAMALQA